MKKNVCLTIIIIACLVLSGCADSDTVPAESGEMPSGITESADVTAGRTEEWMEGLESENGTYPITLPLDPEVSQSLYEASVSEEESLNEEWARWNAVDDVMHDVLNSREFTDAETDEQKAEIVINAMKELAEHGTKTYPEPLIIYGSWEFIPEGQEVRAQYFDGIEFGVTWYDYYTASTAVSH